MAAKTKDEIIADLTKEKEEAIARAEAAEKAAAEADEKIAEAEKVKVAAENTASDAITELGNAKEEIASLKLTKEEYDALQKKGDIETDRYDLPDDGKRFVVRRVDNKRTEKRLLFVGHERLDLGAVVKTGSEVERLKAHRSFEGFEKAGIIKIEELDLDDEKSLRKAIADVVSVPARRRAKVLLEEYIEVKVKEGADE